MARATFRSTAAEDLELHDIIIDPEGNEAQVRRADLVDHKRVRLVTDLGTAIVDRDMHFPKKQ